MAPDSLFTYCKYCIFVFHAVCPYNTHHPFHAFRVYPNLVFPFIRASSCMSVTSHARVEFLPSRSKLFSSATKKLSSPTTHISFPHHTRKPHLHARHPCPSTSSSRPTGLGTPRTSSGVASQHSPLSRFAMLAPPKTRYGPRCKPSR